jgi:hypothetical protein
MALNRYTNPYTGQPDHHTLIQDTTIALIALIALILHRRRKP